MIDMIERQDMPDSHVHNDEELKPSRWTPEFEFNTIVEWRCGQCHKIVYYMLWNASYCPHCNAPIFNYPRKKLDKQQYRGWDYESQHNASYQGPVKKLKSK